MRWTERVSRGVLALVNATLVELRPRRVRRADLLLDGEAIRTVGEPIPKGTRVIDCAGAIVLPGLVCAHTHLYAALARGMPPASPAPATFREILEPVWWRLERALDDEAIEVSALCGAAEAARAGVTTLIDHHASPSLIAGSLDLVGGAVEKIGLRGVLSYAVSDRGTTNEAKAGIAENDRFLGCLRGERPLLRGLVGAHAGFTLGHATTVALADVAVRWDAGVHIQVAEDAGDARHVVPVRDASIVEWLDQYRLLGPRSLLAHCVHVDDAGAERIVASGAHVVHTPRSNMNRGVGYARPGRFGERVTLGTDGVGADLLGEAQAALLVARDHGHAFDPLAALARSQSFAAALFDAGLGRLEPGCPADVTVLDYDPPSPLDEHTLAGHLLCGLGARHVRDVIVAGREVLRDRRLCNIDEEALMARARTVAARLWARM
ncbi:MAG: ssnA protein [Myxococcales bacterium]|nr:ssnA protein [Myxococcales bacterium]